MDRMSLYEMTEQGMQLNDLLRDVDGELTPELEIELDKFLASGKDSIEAAARVVKELSASTTACLEEAKRMNDRAESFRRNTEALKARMLAAVDTVFSGKVKTPAFTIWGQSSGETVSFDLAEGVSEAEVAEKWPDVIRTTFALDRAQLKIMRQQGDAIPPAIVVEQRLGTRFLRIS